QLRTCKVNEKLLARFMLKLHGPFYFGIFTVVMLHELGVTIRIFGALLILFVMVEKSKPWMVTGLIYFFKIKHQLIKAVILYGCVRGEQFNQAGIVKAQELFKRVVACLAQF